jgi:glutamine cyclotransferase
MTLFKYDSLSSSEPSMSTNHLKIFIKGFLILLGVSVSVGSTALSNAGASNKEEGVPVYSYRVVRTFPHDRNAFTQGLVFEKGILYEGTGLHGSSEVRKLELESGRILMKNVLPPRYFGEGITVYKDRLIQLTWRSHTGIVYDKESFKRLKIFHYPTEGWGLTHDGLTLIMSNGTSKLYFLDMETFEITGSVFVRENGVPITELNELEYVKGEIYANVWRTDRIVRIAPGTGQVTGWIDLSGLLTEKDLESPVDVLNGIAHDRENDRLFVTGKWWPKLFEIELVPPN